MNEPRFEVFPETKKYEITDGGLTGDELTGEFIWHFRAANGELRFTGGESFTRRRDAHRAVKGAMYAVLHLFLGDGIGITVSDRRIPVVDLDENGERLGVAVARALEAKPE
jgi:hypothetical protein